MNILDLVPGQTSDRIGRMNNEYDFVTLILLNTNVLGSIFLPAFSAARPRPPEKSELADDRTCHWPGRPSLYRCCWKRAPAYGLGMPFSTAAWNGVISCCDGVGICQLDRIGHIGCQHGEQCHCCLKTRFCFIVGSPFGELIHAAKDYSFNFLSLPFCFQQLKLFPFMIELAALVPAIFFFVL